MKQLLIGLAMVLAFTVSTSHSIAAAQRGAKPEQAAAAAAPVINLNSATAAQIATLPGIGPKTADLIVQYREKNGNFKKVEEIMNVRGIGEKTFLKLKSRITIVAAK